MSQKMTPVFDLYYPDGTVERVKTTPTSMVQFEKRHKKSLVENMDVTAMFWMAWFTKTKGVGDSNFDTWLQGVDSIALIGEDEQDDDPTVSPEAPSGE